MARDYRVQHRMFTSPIDDSVYTPDAELVRTFHRLLDMLSENHAMMIDFCVAEMMRLDFGKNPPELLAKPKVRGR